MATAAQARGSEGTSSQAIWFGPADRPLFGWLHFAAEVSAGVVFCRPVGLEALSARRAYRCIAEGLSQSGLLTLQFDYSGTGDSSGDPSDEVSINRWLSDIGTAIGFVRKAGVSRVGLIGLRLGATLAAKAAADNDVETLVLWDPCETGRGFLREQRMLAVATDLSPERSRTSAGEVEIPGLVLPGDLARSVGALRLDDALDGAAAADVLLLTRPDRPPSANLQKQLSTWNVEYAAATGQDSFIEVEPGASVLPERVMAEIVSWQSGKLEGERTPVPRCVQSGQPTTAVVARLSDRCRHRRKSRADRLREPLRDRHRARGCRAGPDAYGHVHKRRCPSPLGAGASLGQDGS